jgi:dTMP kinase
MKDPEELLEGLDDALDDLREASRRGPVLVEGRRDAAALEALGIDRNVEVLNNGRPLLARCEEIGRSADFVTVLMDWDRKGGELAARLEAGLYRQGLEVDLEVRAQLRRLTRGSVYAVEELASFRRRVEAAARAKGKAREPAESWREKKARKEKLRVARQRRGAPRRSKR